MKKTIMLLIFYPAICFCYKLHLMTFHWVIHDKLLLYTMFAKKKLLNPHEGTSL